MILDKRLSITCSICRLRLLPFKDILFSFSCFFLTFNNISHLTRQFCQILLVHLAHCSDCYGMKGSMVWSDNEVRFWYHGFRFTRRRQAFYEQRGLVFQT